MSLVQKVQVIATRFQAQLARTSPARARPLTQERQALRQAPPRARPLTSERVRLQQAPQPLQPHQTAILQFQEGTGEQTPTFACQRAPQRPQRRARDQGLGY